MYNVHCAPFGNKRENSRMLRTKDRNTAAYFAFDNNNNNEKKSHGNLFLKPIFPSEMIQNIRKIKHKIKIHSVFEKFHLLNGCDTCFPPTRPETGKVRGN